MRKLCFLISILLAFSSFAQNHLSGSQRGSVYTYVYKIPFHEARKLYRSGMKKVSDAYLHTLVDSFRYDEPALPPGNYLFAKAVDNRLQVEPHAAGDLACKFINNHRDLVVALHNRQGQLLSGARVSINGKTLRFDEATQTYRRSQYAKEGLLQVEWNNTLYVFPVHKNKTYQPTFWQTLLQPFKTLFGKAYHRRPDFFYRTKHEQDFSGFLVSSQPKYKPHDTVRIKAFVTTKSGRPLNQSLLLRLSDRHLNLDTILAVIKPYRPGAYEHSFVLSDSLDLDLDTDYLLTLEEEKSRKYDLATYDGDLDEEEYAAKRKVVMRGRFYYEEYELASVRFSARADKPLHSRGEEVSIFLKASDENEMAVMDGRVQLIVKPGTYKTKKFQAPVVFLPDTLWRHEQPLDAVGETRIPLPDSIFPKADFTYEVHCVFLNSNNERKESTLQVEFLDQPGRLAFALQGDSLRIDHLVKGLSQPAAATLYSFNEKEDTLEERLVQLPLRIRVHPHAAVYEVETDALNEEYEVKPSGLVSAESLRTGDSVFIRLVNPARLPVWYTVFAGNKVVHRGRGDSLFYAAKTQTTKHYFLSLQYIFNGQVYNHDYTITYREKLLNVTFHQPAAVYPGQKTTVSVLVNDARGRPVADADVTAWAYTLKFPGASAPSLPYFGKRYPGRKRYATFRADEDRDFSRDTKLAWERWSREMHLDTIEYYKFLHPQTVYVNTEQAADSLTQLAPFVVSSGEVVPVHQLYIDERPVFFSASQHLQRYSFAVSPGRHSLRLRTHNSTIWLDSVEVKKGSKTFLSINADAANPRIRIQKMKPELTAYEKGLWSRYMILLQNNFGERQAYVQDAVQFFALPQSYGAAHWIGPLSGPAAQLVVRNGFTQIFEREGGYQYTISKGLIKQKQLPQSFSIPTHLSPAARPLNFSDVVLTEKILDSLWQEFLYKRSASVDLFTNPYLSKEGNGALHIGLQIDSSGREPFIRNTLLFRYDDPEYLRIYPGNRRDLGFVQPGTYRLFFLLKNDVYFIADSIRVKANGINHYDVQPKNWKPKDSVSSRIAVTIHEKESGRYQYSEAEFNQIKESFNRQYFDAAQLTGTVTGVVRDENGRPVAGASVVLKGSGLGTQTDPFGQFRLQVTPKGTLVISSVGYAPQEIKLREGSEYNLTLAPLKHNLQEVVVVGYGANRRASLTGSLSGVVSEGVSGRIPGIMIRGTATIEGNSAPLLIVDGVPYNGRLEDLDPAGISNTSELKGDVATSLYGTQAANGVILVTTKGAKAALPETAGAELPQTSSLRRNFRDYAYWQPRLRTDAEGRASFTVTYPDDITAWRSFAMVMAGQKQSGFAESLVRSFKVVSGNLSLPQFLVVGDSAAAIGKSLHYGIDTIEAKRSFYLNNQLVKETLLRFRNAWIDTFTVVAPAADSLKLKYTLQKEDGYFDGEERSLPVFRPGVVETRGFFAALRKDTSFTLPAFADTASVHLYAEASVLPTLEKEVESLRNYEYFCNEQLASKLKALLVQKRIDSFLKRPFRHEKQVRDIIGMLSQNKASSGLWGWWKNSEPAIWISLHALEALVQAEAQGYRVSLNKNVLTDFLVFHLESYRSTEKLAALRLLQQLGAKADYRRYTDSLQRDLSRMSLYEKLCLAEIKQAAGLPYTLDSLLTNQHRTMFGNLYWGEEGYRFFDNSMQNTVLMYRLLKKAGGHEDLLEKARGYFLEKRRSGTWRNTYESSLVLETILPDVMVNDALPAEGRFYITTNGEEKAVRMPFTAETGGGTTVSVRKEGGLPLYFTAYQQQWNAAPEKVAGEFTVRSWFEKNGQEQTFLKAGEPVLLKLAVRVKADANYVLVEVPIPAGCSYKDKPQGYGNNEVHREYFKNKVSIFCSSLKKGEYTFIISLLPRFTGRYTLNPAKAEMMYFPVFYGREELKKVRIE